MSLFRDKKVLVVDDFPEFRMSIRQMLLSLKVQDISMANTGEEALKACQRTNFDIILCDYNLGEGKDGQQLLEELRAYKLLKNTAIFVLLTAENTVFMVMGAIENRPDAYLTKPFTRTDLKERLDRLVTFKEETYEINYALDAGNYEAASEACDDLVKIKSPYMTHALRVKAQVLLKLGKLSAAKSLYEMVLKGRAQPWAQFGLAGVLVETKDYDQAEKVLREIIYKNPNYLEAYDLLATVLDIKGQSKEAQSILSSAVAKSPKSPARQHKLGEVAIKNNDIDTATRAMRRNVELSQNGVHQSAQNVIDYVDVLHKKCAQDQSLQGKKAASDALGALEKYKKEIRKDPNAQVMGKVIESKIYTVQDKELLASQAAKEACKIQDQLSHEVSLATTAELAGTMCELGHLEDAAALLNQLQHQNLTDHPDAEFIQQTIQALEKNEELNEFCNSLNEDNQKGVEYYESGLLEEANKAFRKAIETAENSLTINLNLAQSLLKSIQSQGMNEDFLEESQDCFKRIEPVEPSNSRFNRYSELKRLYEEVKLLK